jgi:hypothetical protein
MAKLILHPAQEKVIKSNKRFIGCVAGIRGGKTTVGAVWLLSQIDRDRCSGKLGDST